MRPLCIDGATRLGWAVGEVATAQPFSVNRIASGHFQLTEKAAPVVRWLELWTFIGKLADQYKVTAIGWESPIPRMAASVNQLKLAYGYYAAARMCAFRRELGWLEANNLTVKKYFTGHGVADKMATIAQCHAQGWNVTDDNEADALALLDYLLWCDVNPETVALAKAEKRQARIAKRRRRNMK